MDRYMVLGIYSAILKREWKAFELLEDVRQVCDEYEEEHGTLDTFSRWAFDFWHNLDSIVEYPYD